MTVGQHTLPYMRREVRALADETPQTLLASAGSTLSMSDLFNTTEFDNNYPLRLNDLIAEEEQWSNG